MGWLRRGRIGLWSGLVVGWLWLSMGACQGSGLPAVRAVDPAAPSAPPPALSAAPVRVAAIGDYGTGAAAAADVAQQVQSWNPDIVITLGDNNYPDGEAHTIDRNIGQFYHMFIAPYPGTYGPGADRNRFYPSLGNHDWRSITCQGDRCTGPYLDYFTLPGNERYYDFVVGPLHFFAVDSDPREPHGRGASSRQARWLQQALGRSTAPWQIVYMHHTIYSSSLHGSDPTLQWPYREWGADLVLTGHDHTYERLRVDGLTYIVNGMGGAAIRGFGTPVAGSQVRFNGDHGALLIQATDTLLEVRFITRKGTEIDRWTLRRDCPAAPTGTLLAQRCSSLWLPWIVRP